MQWSRLYRVALQQYSTLLREKPTNEIKLPVKMQEKLQKATKRKEVERLSKLRKTRHRTPVVISCKRTDYNHHLGQSYSDFSPKKLASHGWKHKRSKGDYFTIHLQQGNPAITEASSSFSDLDVNGKLVESLTSQQILSPTNIQYQAIPEILSGGNTLVAAETGSGKTLAYLLPVLQQIWLSQSMYGMKTVPKSPQGLVLVPSKELVHQVFSVGLKLCQFLPLRIHSVTGGQTAEVRSTNMAKIDFDLLISTPGVFRKLVAADIYSTSQLQHLVLDEADTLLDDSFNGLVRSIFHTINPRQSSNSSHEDAVIHTHDGTQVVICGATLPKSLDSIIGDFVPIETLTRVTTDHVHHLLPHVAQKFMRLGLKEKPEALLKLAKTNHKKRIPTLVFCNKTSTCFFLHKTLEDAGVPNILFTGGRNEMDREGRFQSFQKGECDILIGTDVASRGLDTTRAQHVINYDFPNFMSDYIHRAGRVGRVGGSTTGFVVSFVSYKWDVDLLWQIESAARKMTELHNVNANIKRKLRSLHSEEVDREV